MHVLVLYNLPYSWELVASVFWKRFPNPYAKYVLSEDVLERRWISRDILYTKRLIVKDIFGVFPHWIRNRIPNKSEMVVEESIINRKDNRINTITKNIGSLTRYGVITETCSYEASNEDSSSQTSVHRVGNIESYVFGFFRRPLNHFLESKCLKSARRSNLGLAYICRLNSGEKTTMVQRVRDSLQNAATRACPQVVSASSKDQY